MLAFLGHNAARMRGIPPGARANLIWSVVVLALVGLAFGLISQPKVDRSNVVDLATRAVHRNETICLECQQWPTYAESGYHKFTFTLRGREHVVIM
jgi:hypothetical protein